MASQSRVRNIEDLRQMAKTRLPKFIFDYIDGGADDEVTVADNTAAFQRLKLAPKALVDISAINTGITLMGDKLAHPFFPAPTAAQRLFHPRAGERAVARAAGKTGLIYTLSSMSTHTLETVAAETSAPKWFQLYVWRDKALVQSVLRRARQAGYTGLALTVDVPVPGNRERDPANDFSLPPTLTLRNAWQAIKRPGYMLDLATTPRIEPANFDMGRTPRGMMEILAAQFDLSKTWDYVGWLKDVWQGPLAIKGIVRADDAEGAIRAGADGIWVSNHGGRQLDTAAATIDCLPAIAAKVKGRASIILDGGIRRGTDVVKALALGADGVAIGRPFLYGLAAGGEAGAAKAFDLMAAEVTRAMGLLGITRIADITPDCLFDTP